MKHLHLATFLAQLNSQASQQLKWRRQKKKNKNKTKQIFFSKTLVNCPGTHLAKPCYLASAYWASLSASVLCTGLLLVLSCVLLWFDPPESGLFRILSYKNKKKCVFLLNFLVMYVFCFLLLIDIFFFSPLTCSKLYHHIIYWL